MLAQFSRFAGIGLLATLIHVLVALMVRNWADVNVQAANFAGFLAAVTFSYFGHAEVTFTATGSHQQQMLRFGVLAGLGLALSSSLTFTICNLWGGSFALAMGVVAIAVPGLTFLASKYWVFADTTAQSNHRDWIGVAFAVGFAVLYFLIYQDRPINHDTSWYLVATKKWLAGAQLYVDIVEVNPPLNFYLTVPVIYLAALTGLSETNAQYLFLSGLMAISLIWVWRLLLQHATLDLTRRVLMLTAVAAAMSFPAVASAGQREHLMVILVMPYLLGYILLPGAGRGKSGMARAAFAAIGICIKPHFLLIPVTLTVTEILLTRSLRPVISGANLTIFLIGAAYVGAAALLHPEYFTSIIPTAMLVYGAYGFDTATVYRSLAPIVPGLFLAASMFACLYGLGRQMAFPVAAVFAACGIYFAQWTGYRYQALPVHAFVMVGLVWLIVQSHPVRALSILSAVGLLACANVAFQNGFYRNLMTESLLPTVLAETPNPRIMLFSSSLGPSFPLITEANAEWTSRYPALWLVPGAVNSLMATDCNNAPEHCKQLQYIQNGTRWDIVDDFVRSDPNILIFDTYPPYVYLPFSFFDFLSGDPRFSNEMRQYRVIKSDDRFTIWGLRSEDAWDP